MPSDLNIISPPIQVADSSNLNRGSFVDPELWSTGAKPQNDLVASAIESTKALAAENVYFLQTDPDEYANGMMDAIVGDENSFSENQPAARTHGILGAYALGALLLLIPKGRAIAGGVFVAGSAVSVGRDVFVRREFNGTTLSNLISVCTLGALKWWQRAKQVKQAVDTLTKSEEAARAVSAASAAETALSAVK